MNTVTDAIFTNGVLRPLQALPLREQERVRLTIESIERNGASTPEARSRMIEGFQRMRLRSNGTMPSRDQLHERG